MAGKRGTAPILGVLVVMIGLFAAGCGGDGQSDTTTASITKAEFVTKANAACARIHGQAQAELVDYMKNQTGEPTTADLGKRFVIAPKRREVEEFIALGLPSEDEDQVRAIVVAFETGISKAEAEPAQVAQNSTEAFGVPEKLATEFGLEGC